MPTWESKSSFLCYIQEPDIRGGRCGPLRLRQQQGRERLLRSWSQAGGDLHRGEVKQEADGAGDVPAGRVSEGRNRAVVAAVVAAAAVVAVVAVAVVVVATAVVVVVAAAATAAAAVVAATTAAAAVVVVVATTAVVVAAAVAVAAAAIP